MVARSLDVCIALHGRTQNMVSITAPSPQCDSLVALQGMFGSLESQE